MSDRSLCTYDEDQAEIDRILKLSGEELRAEMIAEGIDPDQAVRDIEHEIAVATFLHRQPSSDPSAYPSPYRTEKTDGLR